MQIKNYLLLFAFLLIVFAPGVYLASLDQGGALAQLAPVSMAAAFSAPAGAEELSGWAWSENVGWISFNYKNCDRDGNGYLDLACGGDNSAKPVGARYGVFLSNGQLSGYAWSGNIGYIYFGPSRIASSIAMPTSLDSSDGEKNWAYVDTDNVLSGWARACSVFKTTTSSATDCMASGLRDNTERGGWDGWIKMSGTWSNPPVLDSSTSKVTGFAWGGGSGTTASPSPQFPGWISFNPTIASGPYCGDGSCNNGETHASCPTDCPCSGPGCSGSCGNSMCDTDHGESCLTCASDCGSCPSVCTSSNCGVVIGEPTAPAYAITGCGFDGLSANATIPAGSTVKITALTTSDAATSYIWTVNGIKNGCTAKTCTITAGSEDLAVVVKANVGGISYTQSCETVSVGSDINVRVVDAISKVDLGNLKAQFVSGASSADVKKSSDGTSPIGIAVGTYGSTNCSGSTYDPVISVAKKVGDGDMNKCTSVISANCYKAVLSDSDDVAVGATTNLTMTLFGKDTWVSDGGEYLVTFKGVLSGGACNGTAFEKTVNMKVTASGTGEFYEQ